MDNLGRDLRIKGALLTMHDKRNKLAHQVAKEVRLHFPGNVFEAVIPRCIRLAEAPSYGVPGVLFDKAAKGAQAYLAFAVEMIDRVNSWKDKS